jgi:hypothetical protein
MRRFSPLAVILLLAACNDTEIPSALAPEDAVLSAHPSMAEEVPIQLYYRPSPVGAEMIQCTTPDGDPTPVEIASTWSFSGQLSYIERLDASKSLTQFLDCSVTLEGSELTGFSARTETRLEGPRGDALIGTGTLEYGVAPLGIGTGELTITGGEGKFAGAAGSIAMREYPLWLVGEEGEGSVGMGHGAISRAADIEGRPIRLDFTFEPDLSEGTCDVVVPGVGIVAQLPSVSHGTGQASHIGRSSTTITHDWCGLDPERGIVSGGSFETIGVNGAAVVGVWGGYLAEDGGIALTGWINDGTGRFTASWGELAIRGFSDPTEGGWFEAAGRIVY